MKPSRISLIVLLTLCLALVFAPTAQAYRGNQINPSLVPTGRPHSVNFATSGLADGVSITISGNRTNNGGNSVPFILTFTSPGPDSAITAQPGSDIIYFDGYPDQYVLGDTIFTLIDITPTSPFTAGLSGETTTVLGIYTSCTRPIFTSQPVSTTVMIGGGVSFSVIIADPASVSYQWYKDDLEISGANESTYTIDAAEFNDGGTYHVVASNLCGSVQSDPAELTVSKLSQTIDFPPPPSPAAFNTSFTVSPTASSGLTVTLQASGGCQIAGNQVTMTSGSLDCTLIASQPGNDDYLPAGNVQHVVAAAKASQTIDFPPPPSLAAFGASFTVSPTASSGLTVTLQASGGCQIAGNQVTMTSSSLDCTLTASQPGDDDYLPAVDVQGVVAAAKASQTIDFTPPTSPAAFGASFTVSPTASSGLTVTLQALGGCQIAGNLVTMTSGSLDCTLSASQPGDDDYLPAEGVQHVVAAAKASQTIDFPSPPSLAVFGASFTVSPIASSGLTVTLQASGGCQIAGNQVTMTSGSLDCTLTASQPGDDDYLPAEGVQHVVAAAKASQTIDFPPPPSLAAFGASFTVSPTASSGLAVSLTASGSCTSTGYLVTMTQSSGICTLAASHLGDENYSQAEPVVHTVQAVEAVYHIFLPVIGQ